MAESKGGAGRRRAKNQAMAAEMKRLGVERKTGRCSVCYQIVSNGIAHIMVCKGPRPK